MPPPPRNRFVPSLLDRLLDDDPRGPEQPLPSEGKQLNALKAGVKRDLENLLNSRVPLRELPRGCLMLSTSLANYGLPDLQSESIRGRSVEELCSLIRECIGRFEPRLKHVNVRPIDANVSRPFNRRFNFSIDAVLIVEPFREEVQFESTAEPSTGTILVTSVR